MERESCGCISSITRTLCGTKRYSIYFYHFSIIVILNHPGHPGKCDWNEPTQKNSTEKIENMKTLILVF